MHPGGKFAAGYFLLSSCNLFHLFVVAMCELGGSEINFVAYERASTYPAKVDSSDPAILTASSHLAATFA